MGSLRRKTWNKPLPPGAELFNRKGEAFARWRDRNGKTKTALVASCAASRKLPNRWPDVRKTGDLAARRDGQGPRRPDKKARLASDEGWICQKLNREGDSTDSRT